MQAGGFVKQVAGGMVHDQVRVDPLWHLVRGLRSEDWTAALAGLDLVEDQIHLPASGAEHGKLAN
ncbi:hypothetical protein ACWEQ2_36165 [Streptomyces sp. NPDC004096]